jgi:hypothetical protein
MLELFQDVVLAFCPASVRAVCRPYSSMRVLWAATLTGALETFVFTRWLLHNYLAFLAERGRQYGYALQQQNETTQAWFFIVFAFEYLLFHPLAWLLAYLSLEGFIRFAGGLCASEVIPSLPVVLAFKIKTAFSDRGIRRELRSQTAVADSLEMLGGERMRVAASRPKEGWNASLTIGIDGECYEVESEERGSGLRPYIYILRRAPIGKALRGYEEYDLAAAMKHRQC